jgi:PKD repeat protein
MRVIARGYLPENRTINVTGNMTEDFDLQPTDAYYLRDSRSPCGPTFSWVDATDGEGHNVGDDAYFYLPLTNTFSFYGETYPTIFVGSNGFLSFGQGYSRGHMMIPFEGMPNNAIYGFEEDLNPANGAQGVIYHKYLDNGRYLVIEFNQVEHWASGYPETFEFILDFETGAILVQYLEVSLPDFTTVGIENADGSDGILYSYANSAGITNSLAVGFYPVYGGFPADQGDPAAYGTLSGTVYITGTTTPVPGATVTAWSYLHVFTTTTDVVGDYLFPDVCADIYWLQASDPSYYPSQVAEARLRWDGDIAVSDLYLNLCDPVHSADFDWTPMTPTLDMEVTFQGTASGTTPISFTWNLGDGTTAEGTIVTHTYAATGTYTVHMTATNCETATAIVSDNVVVVAPEIVPPPPPPPEQLDPGGETYDVITVTNAGEGGLIWSLAESPDAPWLVEAPVSGTLAAGESVTVLLTYTAPITTGVYTTNLQINSNDPLNPVVDVPVEMEVLPPCEAVQIVAINPTLSGCFVTFAAELTGEAPFVYLWAFGDGMTSTAAIPTHTYTQTGTYSGTLDVWNCAETGHASADFTVSCVARYTIYLPVVMKGYTP